MKAQYPLYQMTNQTAMTFHLICFVCKIIIICCSYCHISHIEETVIQLSHQTANTCGITVFHICCGSRHIFDFHITAAGYSTDHSTIRGTCFTSTCGNCPDIWISSVGSSFYGQCIFHNDCTIFICTSYSIISSDQSAQICHFALTGHVCRDGTCRLS